MGFAHGSDHCGDRTIRAGGAFMPPPGETVRARHPPGSRHRELRSLGLECTQTDEEESMTNPKCAVPDGRIARGLSRREFIRAATAAGLSVAMAGSLWSQAQAATAKKGGTLRLGADGGATTDTLSPLQALGVDHTTGAVVRELRHADRNRPCRQSAAEPRGELGGQRRRHVGHPAAPGGGVSRRQAA